MIWQQDIQDAIFKHIAEQMKCSVDELHSGETNFIMDETVSKRYVKILSVGDTNVVTVSKNIYSEAMRCLRGKNRDELYESDFVFGQTLHYVPDLSQMSILPYTNDFTFELLVNKKTRKDKLKAPKPVVRPEISDEEVSKQVRQYLWSRC